MIPASGPAVGKMGWKMGTRPEGGSKGRVNAAVEINENLAQAEGELEASRDVCGQ